MLGNRHPIPFREDGWNDTCVPDHLLTFIMRYIMSQNEDIYAIDFGNGGIACVWGDVNTPHDQYRAFRTLVELMDYLPVGCTLIAERSASSFGKELRNKGIDLAEKKLITIKATNTHGCKNWRRAQGLRKPKNARFDDDILDAKILYTLYARTIRGQWGTGKLKRVVQRDWAAPLTPFELLVHKLKDTIQDVRSGDNSKDKWQLQKDYLTFHGLENVTVLCSAWVIAEGVREHALTYSLNGKEARDLYRSLARISEYGRALPLHRSNGTHWLYHTGDWNDPLKRKARGKEINRIIDKIWSLTKEENRVQLDLHVVKIRAQRQEEKEKKAKRKIELAEIKRKKEERRLEKIKREQEIGILQFM